MRNDQLNEIVTHAQVGRNDIDRLKTRLNYILNLSRAYEIPNETLTSVVEGVHAALLYLERELQGMENEALRRVSTLKAQKLNANNEAQTELEDIWLHG